METNVIVVGACFFCISYVTSGYFKFPFTFSVDDEEKAKLKPKLNLKMAHILVKPERTESSLNPG